MWLHLEEVEEIRKPSRTLTLLERLNISVDVASVLDYVHCYDLSLRYKTKQHPPRR